MGPPAMIEPEPVYIPPPPPGPSSEELAALVDAHGFSGALLKMVRELQDQTLADLASRTRISERYLEALEKEEADALPSATFVRGYVREVARALNVDPDPLVAGYMQRLLG
jgi:DNA-binding XRE family transcriptional regulator